MLLSVALHDRYLDRTAWILIGLFTAFMLWFGAAHHPIEEVNSGEWDNYVAQIDRVRNGELPTDPYRPALYPIASAATGALLGDSFAGARTVSSLFAALFVLSAFLVGRRLMSSTVGLFAATAMMLNHNVIRFGVHATTDMMFAGLAGMMVFAALRVSSNARFADIIHLALWFAMSYFTRYTAVGLLPLAAITIVAGRSGRRALPGLLVFALASVVFLLPHFVLTWKAFGDPLHNENWRNLAFKLYGNWDWTYLAGNPFDGTWSVIAHDPVRFLSSAARETAKFGALTLGHLGGYWLAGWLFTAFSLAGIYVAARRPTRHRLVLLAFIAGYVLVICTFFYTSPRFMLPVIPACYVLAGCWLVVASTPRRRIAALSTALVFLVITAVATAREIPGFIDSHPLEELRAIERLEHEYGTGIAVLGTAPYFQRHLACEYRVLKFRERVSTDDEFVAQLQRHAQDADFVVIGRLTGRGVPAMLVDATATPSFLEVVEANSAVAVYRVRAQSETTGER
jgi:hypothetical protein